MEKKEIEALATKYDLPIEFVTKLHDKVSDKGNFERALRMFVNGTLKYEVAAGNDPINVADIRKEVAGNYHVARKKIQEQIAKERKIAEYYHGCHCVMFRYKPNKAVSDVVFVKDGHLVAFAHYEPKQGGIYAANNEVMPNFNWNPHKDLERLRKMNKTFYRKVKKAANVDVWEHKDWFDFNIK